MHVLFSLSRIIMSGLLLGIVLSVCTCWFHSYYYYYYYYFNNNLNPTTWYRKSGNFNL